MAEYRESNTHAGVAEAYAAYGEAQWLSHPEDEPRAWQLFDKAVLSDPADPAVAKLKAMLPPRVTGFDFSQRPADIQLVKDVEADAQACYASAADRQVYFDEITAENDRLSSYIKQIKTYLDAIRDQDAALRRRGYIQFYGAFNEEWSRWNDRWQSVLARSTGLIRVWWPYVADHAHIPCAQNEATTPLPPPPGYDRLAAGAGLRIRSWRRAPLPAAPTLPAPAVTIPSSRDGRSDARATCRQPKPPSREARPVLSGDPAANAGAAPRADGGRGFRATSSAAAPPRWRSCHRHRHRHRHHRSPRSPRHHHKLASAAACSSKPLHRAAASPIGAGSAR